MAIVLPRLYPTLDYGFCNEKGLTCIATLREWFPLHIYISEWKEDLGTCFASYQVTRPRTFTSTHSYSDCGSVNIVSDCTITHFSC